MVVIFNILMNAQTAPPFFHELSPSLTASSPSTVRSESQEHNQYVTSTLAHPISIRVSLHDVSVTAVRAQYIEAVDYLCSRRVEEGEDVTTCP